jgi:hypothetical protein
MFLPTNKHRQQRPDVEVCPSVLTLLVFLDTLKAYGGVPTELAIKRFWL